MPHTLDAIIQHVHMRARPDSRGAVLVREIERLRAEVDGLRSAIVPTRLDRHVEVEWLRGVDV